MNHCVLQATGEHRIMALSIEGSTSHPGTLCGFNLEFAKPQLLHWEGGDNQNSALQLSVGPPTGQQGQPGPVPRSLLSPASQPLLTLLGGCGFSLTPDCAAASDPQHRPILHFLLLMGPPQTSYG